MNTPTQYDAMRAYPAPVNTPKGSKVFRYELRLRVCAPVDTSMHMSVRDNRMVLADLLVASDSDSEQIERYSRLMTSAQPAFKNYPHIRAAIGAAVAMHPDKAAHLVLEVAMVAP